MIVVLQKGTKTNLAFLLPVLPTAGMTGAGMAGAGETGDATGQISSLMCHSDGT